MKRNICTFSIALLLCIIATITSLSANSNSKPRLKVNKVEYYGFFRATKFLSGETFEKPFLLTEWPGEYVPDTIIVKAEIENCTGRSIRDIRINAKLRYKAGELGGGTDVRDSRNNLVWQKSFIDKQIIAPLIKPNSKLMIDITEFNIEKDLDAYEDVGKRPWVCQTILSFVNPNLSLVHKSILPIEVTYEGE